MEEPTENLSGGHCSRSKDYGCPAGTFDPEQGEDLMSSLFLLSESQSPQPSSPWLSLPPAEGFAAPGNFSDGQISPLDEMPCIPAAVAEETNYAAAPPAPLVAGQFSFNFSLSSTTCDEFDEGEVQQAMVPWQLLLHQPMVPDGLSNTTNGGPEARSHADAVPPLVQQDTRTIADDPPHPQQQLPLPTNDPDPEAQPGGGWTGLDLSPADDVQIQQMAPTIWPSQPPPSPTPMTYPGLDETNHAASAPMGSQDGSDKLFVMGIDVMRQFARYIGKMTKEEEKHRAIVWQHFWTSRCEHCFTLSVICQYCNTVLRYPSSIELLRHLESRHNDIHLLPAASRASKAQRSSQALQIKEIAENPNGTVTVGQSRDNSNCATVARVDTPGTNTVVLSPRQQHQLIMDREEQIATILSSQPCCQERLPCGQTGRASSRRLRETLYWPQDLVGSRLVAYMVCVRDSLWDLIIRLSDSSSTTKSTHDGFRLKFYSKKEKEKVYKIVYVRSSLSAAWVHVRKNPSQDQNHASGFLRTLSNTIGSSLLLSSVEINEYDWDSGPAGCAYPWRWIHRVLCSLGFRKEFARDLVIYALGRVDERNLWLRSPSSSDKGKSIVEQAGDVSSGKRKRKSAPPRSKVWNHFTKEVVEAEGSTVTMAKCNHCGSELKAGSASHGTTHLARHIRSIHPDHAKSL